MDNLSVQDKWVMKKTVIFFVKISLTTTIRRKNHCPVSDKFVLHLYLGFCPNFFQFFKLIFVAFGKIIFQKFATKRLWGRNFVWFSWVHFTITKIMNNVISWKTRVLISLVGAFETGKPQLIQNWLKIGTFQPNSHKKYTFYHNFQIFYEILRKEIDNFDFVQGVNFQYIDSLAKDRYKVLIIFRRFKWRDLQFKSSCWYCYRWKTSWIE